MERQTSPESDDSIELEKLKRLKSQAVYWLIETNRAGEALDLSKMDIVLDGVVVDANTNEINASQAISLFRRLDLPKELLDKYIIRPKSE